MAETARKFDLTELNNTLSISFELGEGRWTLGLTLDLKKGFGYSTYRLSSSSTPPWPNPDFSPPNGICTASQRTFMKNPD